MSKVCNICVCVNYQEYRDASVMRTGPGSRLFLRLKRTLSLRILQSGPQDQKCVTFSHSVISLNQLLQNSINTAYIFLTFRNHVKIFLSQNILHNVSNVVYCKSLSIGTDWSDKPVKTRIRLLLDEQSD